MASSSAAFCRCSAAAKVAKNLGNVLPSSAEMGEPEWMLEALNIDRRFELPPVRLAASSYRRWALPCGLSMCFSREACSPICVFFTLTAVNSKPFTNVDAVPPDDVFRCPAESNEGDGNTAEGESEFSAALEAVQDKVLQAEVRSGWVESVGDKVLFS